MKRVYQCDFCTETEEDIVLIQIHELKCEHNPKNKECLTCFNYQLGKFCYSEKCVDCKQKTN